MRDASEGAVASSGSEFATPRLAIVYTARRRSKGLSSMGTMDAGGAEWVGRTIGWVVR